MSRIRARDRARFRSHGIPAQTERDRMVRGSLRLLLPCREVASLAAAISEIFWIAATPLIVIDPRLDNAGRDA